MLDSLKYFMKEWPKYPYDPNNLTPIDNGRLVGTNISPERSFTITVDPRYNEEEIIDDYGWRFHKQMNWRDNQLTFTEVEIKFDDPDQNVIERMNVRSDLNELLVETVPLNRNFDDLPHFEPMSIHYLQDGSIGGLSTRIWTDGNEAYAGYEEIYVVRANGDGYEYIRTGDYYSYPFDLDPPGGKFKDKWQPLDDPVDLEYNGNRVHIEVNRTEKTIKLSQTRTYPEGEVSASIGAPIKIDFQQALNLLCGNQDYRILETLIPIKANYSGLYTLPNEYTRRTHDEEDDSE